MNSIHFVFIVAVVTAAAATSKADVPCKTYVECDRQRIQLGFSWGLYTDEDLKIDSKGCFSKNDNMFFSPGNDNEKMTRTDLPGLRIRVFCNDIIPSTTSANKKLAQAEMLETASNDNLDLTSSSSSSSSSSSGSNKLTEAGVELEMIDTYPKIPCATMEQCNNMRKMMGIEFGTYEDLNFPTKGCFYKGDKAYFSDGSYDEMATSELPREQNRIYCTDNSFVQSSTIVSSTMVSASSMQTSSNYFMITVSCLGLATSLLL